MILNSTSMFIFNSSIGKKFIQAVSGAFLILFLLLHSVINFFSVIDSFTGKFGSVAVDDKLFSAGDGLFKLGCDFMSTPVISLMVPVLALGFVVHIAYGCWLTAKNMMARGGVKRYEVSSRAATDSWAARNMFVLGIVILGIIVFHLFHFWAKMQMPELLHIGTYVDDPYLLLTTVFGHWWILLIYILWFAAIWFHLTHGFWSALQTLGWSGKIWFNRWKCIGNVYATVIILMFAAVVICFQARALCCGACC